MEYPTFLNVLCKLCVSEGTEHGFTDLFCLSGESKLVLDCMSDCYRIISRKSMHERFGRIYPALAPTTGGAINNEKPATL